MTQFTRTIKTLKNPTVRKICEWIDIKLGLHNPQFYYISSDGTVYIEFEKLPGKRVRVASGKPGSDGSVCKWNIASHMEYIKKCEIGKINFYGSNQLNKFCRDFVNEINKSRTENCNSQQSIK